MRNISVKQIPLLLIAFCCMSFAKAQWNPNYSIASFTGKYVYAPGQLPGKLVELRPSVYIPNAALQYQWESSILPLSGYTAITSLSTANAEYTFLSPPDQSMYYRRKVLNPSNGSYVYADPVFIEVASATWEDINYVREHDIRITGQTDWKVIDQLSIGDKAQTTTYMDGLGRPLQKVAREAATPTANPGSSLWGDIVLFSAYDQYGRQPKQYLPYTTTSESGKYKTDPLTTQQSYYQTNYNENVYTYANPAFDNSPLNRVLNIKAPGESWALSNGNSVLYDLNDDNDAVQILSVDNSGFPYRIWSYAAKTLFKTIQTDENGKKTITFTNKSGQLILKKIQIDDTPADAYTGWICTYSIYDDMGALRYNIQPEAVKYLAANNWSFLSTDGLKVLYELCFHYEYDEKGRTILKWAPGAKELKMIYDARDRVVFMQDGNQRAKTTPEWTLNLYDELDRQTVTTLYKTNKTVAALQTAISSSVTIATFNVAVQDPSKLDMFVTTRQAGVTRYAATNSISFVADAGSVFETEADAEFDVEIDPTVAMQPFSVTTASFSSPISSGDMNNDAVTTILKYSYYDTYSFAGAKTFDNNFDNTTAYNTSDANVLPIATTKRVMSFPTGSMVRVLGSNIFLASTTYYDEDGQPVQTLEDNLKAGTDVVTMQYHFDGRLLSTYTKHTVPGSGYTNFGILTKNNYDKAGRITSLEKKYGTNAGKIMATYEFDDMGRLKTKHLDPGYTGSGKSELESLAYSYNIHNNITGINKDYALKTSGVYGKWDNFFGLYIGYDNKDNVFDNAKLNGQVGGLLWNTMGDDAQRKYDYTYDNAGRLTKALFKQKQNAGDTWDNSKIDFSITGSGGKIGYDLNGNILSMLQKGVMAGSSAPVTVDDLQYTYASYSNKLLKVTDNTPLTALNGTLGDFKDGSNGATDDYVYDDNGNLVADLNKNVPLQGGAPGIVYNFLDKPEQITIAGKGVIKIVYDADGNRLQKIFTPQTGTARTTTYINQFVYEDLDLQYINFEEGRIRVIQPVAQSNATEALQIAGNMTLPSNKQGAYEYFIRDYQQNVRMILTEEVHLSSGTATMEMSRASAEEPVFGKVGGSNEVAATRFPVADIPGQSTGNGWDNSLIGSSISRIGNQAAGKVGPNSLLKVMAGDLVSATTQYYYQNHSVTTGSNSSTMLDNVIASLLGAMNGGNVTSYINGKGASIGTQLAATPGFGNLATHDELDASTGPKAWLSVLFFDERFNLINENSTQIRATTANSNDVSLTLSGIKAPKNGYAYIYVSNSSDEPVYFDNFKVGHTRGRIVEEDHYYAFGLKIAGISSHKLADATGNEGHVQNNNLYNDKELFDEGDLNWYDYGFRYYDAQIGRFVQLDPLTDDYPYYSPYQFAGDEPIANIDIDGLEPGISILGNVAPLANDVMVTGIRKALTSPTALSMGGNFLKGLKIAGGALVQAGTAVYNGAVSVARVVNQVNPLANLVEVITGKSSASDFTDNKPRMASVADLGVNTVSLFGGGIAAASGKVVQGTRVATAAEAVGTTVEGASSAKNAVNGVKLGKQLASEAQMSERGTEIAGKGTDKALRKAGEMAKEHGGNASDYAKKSSSSYTAKDGAKISTHWEENTITGQRVNVKTKIE